jgi:hypothetical protein
MSTLTYVPVEVYLRSSEYEPDAEYVDGHSALLPGGRFEQPASRIEFDLSVIATFLQK